MKPILVTCYVNPDLDGTAGAMAYAEFLQKKEKNVLAGIVGEMHDEAKYVLDHYNLKYPQIVPNSDDFEQVILVDASEINGLEGKIEPEKVIEIIDHRKVNDANKFPNTKIQIELVGSVATLIAEKFMRENIEISKSSTILLYAAIISNTLNFKATVMTDRDKNAAEYLNKTAKLPDNFWLELFEAKSDLSGSKLKERIEGDSAWFTMNGKKVWIAQVEIIGAQKLVDERSAEIVAILDQIKTEYNLDFIFQNTIDLAENRNFFVAGDKSSQTLLEKVFNIKFNGFVAEKSGFIMRKQIVPLLKDELEKH